MKSIAFIFLLSSAVVACKTGEIPYEGTCAQDLKPQEAATSTPTSDPKIVSSEKPRHGQQPVWQTGEVKADLGKPGIEPDTSTAHDYASEGRQK